MTRAELRYVVARHEKWLRHPDSGERANLRRADLREADLQGANLRRADLREADLQGANLRRADLREADLQGANLREADLQGANLREADLQGANLRRADLREADFDYSSWPLWCGSLHAKADDRLVIQLLFHTLTLAQGSEISDELKNVLDTDALIEQANRFHRTAECMPLGRWPKDDKTDERTNTEAEPL